MPVSLILILLVGLLVLAAPQIQKYWILWRATSATTELIARQCNSPPTLLQVDVTIGGVQEALTISEVCVERNLHDAVGVGPPPGFREEAYSSVAVPDDEGNELVAIWDAQWVRYAGEVQVRPGRPISFVFPIAQPSNTSGELKFQYVQLLGTGGIVGHTVVPVRLSNGKAPEEDGVEQGDETDEAR